MFRTISTSAAVAVAALAIVTGASAAYGTQPVGCSYAMPTSRAQAIACSQRDVNAPLSQAVLQGIAKAKASTPTYLEEGLDPAIAESLREQQASRSALDPAIRTYMNRSTGSVPAVTLSGDSGFDWSSALIGGAFGAAVLLTAVGSGAALRRRRSPLHA
jgi:hypothetical protein